MVDENDEAAMREVETMRRMEVMRKAIMEKILTKRARERLGRLRLVKPDIAAQLELYLMQLYQTGKLNTQLTDEQLKSILEMLSSKKEFKIIRREK